MSIRKWFFVLAVLGLGTALLAQTATIRVPGDAPDIPSAISQASSIINGPAPSDVVIDVAPGTYVGPFNLSPLNNPNYSVSLLAMQGPSVTRLQRTDCCWVLTGAGVRNFTLDGFSVRNRSADPINSPSNGMRLNDSTNITVQNCAFDVSNQAMTFNVSDPALSSRVQVVNNLVIAGDTNEVNPYLYGQAVSMVINDTYPSTGEHRLIVADNTLRTGASAVRFLHYEPDEFGNNIRVASGGTLEMVRNDVTSWFAAGHNLIGGHNHYVAANRIHDGQVGLYNMCGGSGVWENNVLYNNIQGAIFSFCAVPLAPITRETRVFRHNTVVNNKGTGFIYLDSALPHDPLPVVYNNIVAFNNYSGIVTLFPGVSGTATSMQAYVPYDLSLDHNDVYGNTLSGFPDSTFFVLTGTVGTPGLNYSGIVPNGKDLSVDPGFYDPLRPDFSLKNTSKLVNAGLVSLPLPLRDFVLNQRDSKPDIGAYEYVEPPNFNVRTTPASKAASPMLH
ncbi:MAG TPA: right-handed parallel beta-helix repeat-containing protein [Candidatus Bathyarchaeia archaeon]|nr:right-handed parallel beta-helix repeat-containing protein [Candidatus Bathyarchaeia archaeon]